VATLASPEIVAYERIGLWGFSLGGHVALRLAIDSPPAQLRAVATVCPPVDLAAAATTIDSGSSWIYRRYLLRRLFEIYEEVARRRQVETSVEEVKRVSTFVEFDSLVIAPRFGFADAWDYYRTVSVGPDLARLQVPSLIVAAAGDPMVPVGSLKRYVPGASAKLEWFWSKHAGHMSFPARLDLGAPAALGLYPQIQGWLSHRLMV
jgi:predicted alpha/beta-fold hydrolase